MPCGMALAACLRVAGVVVVVIERKKYCSLKGKIIIMTSEHIDEVLEYLRRKWEKGLSKEDALHELQSAGILDENGDFAPQYKHLRRWLQSKRQPDENEAVKLVS
jgi:hypothetical protein